MKFKKLLLITAVTIVLLSAASFTALASEYTVTNVTDMQKHIAGIIVLSEEKQKEYDFNNDGKINISDTTYLQKLIAQNSIQETTQPITEATEPTTIIYPSSLELNKTSLTLGIGEKYTLVKDTDIPEFPFVFTSSNSKIATVDSNGTVTAVSCGTVTITCSTGNGLKASCNVTVGEMAQSITLNKTNLTLGVGEEFDLNSYISENTFAYFRWYSSSNSDVASVAKSGGLVTAKKQGTATITCKLYNGLTATCQVTVKAAPSSVSLSVSNKTLKVGENFTISENTNTGSYAYGFTWISSNKNVATVTKSVSNKAVISPRMQGTATITIKTYNGKSASCKITVKGSSVKCLDVSDWQYSIDFNKVKADGYDYVIIRAGYGKETYQKDARFEENYKNAKAAGLKVGAYWYSYATSTAEALEEAEACLYCIDGKTFDMPLYYDVEETAQAYLSKKELTNLVDSFCSAIERNGYKAGVYSNNSMFANMEKEYLKSKYSTWIAQIDGDFTAITDDVHQYTWTQKVDGISTNVDCNYIYNLNIIK